MWFQRAELLLRTVAYAKSVVTNIEAMCNTFVRLCTGLAATSPKIKLNAEIHDFIVIYTGHEIPYSFLQLYSAETFEAFVVSSPLIVQDTFKGRADKLCKRLDCAKAEGQKKFKVKKIVHKTAPNPNPNDDLEILPPASYTIK